MYSIWNSSNDTVLSVILEGKPVWWIIWSKNGWEKGGEGWVRNQGEPVRISLLTLTCSSYMVSVYWFIILYSNKWRSKWQHLIYLTPIHTLPNLRTQHPSICWQAIESSALTFHIGMKYCDITTLCKRVCKKCPGFGLINAPSCRLIKYYAGYILKKLKMNEWRSTM